MALETEIQKYESILPSLLGHEGKFIVICSDDVSDCYDSYADATRFGYEKYGLKPFLVKKIARTEQVAFLTRHIGTACPV